MEKLAQKIDRLTRELETAQHEIAECEHEFAEPVSATRPLLDPIFKGYKGVGSDPEPVYEWIEKTEYGWERTCNKCGHTEYTAQKKPVVKGYEPDFQAQIQVM